MREPSVKGQWHLDEVTRSTSTHASCAESTAIPACLPQSADVSSSLWRESFTSQGTGGEEQPFFRDSKADKDDWSRVSLSRTPPFDALNGPSPSLRMLPSDARPRAEHESSSDPGRCGRKGAIGPEEDIGSYNHQALTEEMDGISGPISGSDWVDFFAPPHRMAPTGDVYVAETLRSVDASAGTTIRAVSNGTCLSCTSDGLDDHRVARQQVNQESCWSQSSVGSQINCTAQSPMLGVPHRKRSNVTSATWRDRKSNQGSESWSQEDDYRDSERLWDEAAERSREYRRRWQTFLARAGAYFDCEVKCQSLDGHFGCFCAAKQSKG